MEYSYIEIANIRSKAHSFVNAELNRAIASNTIDEFLEKYCITIEEEWMPFETRRAKVLVLGGLSCNRDELISVAKKLGFSKDSLEFISDYSNLTNLDVNKYRNSTVYSDIIFGPVPHKQIGIGDSSSFIALIQNNPAEFPRATKAIANGVLKITKNSFEHALKQTRYYEKIILGNT